MYFILKKLGNHWKVWNRGMKGSGGMSPREKNRTDYVICLTVLRDVSKTPHSFLSESLGVNQLTFKKTNKQTKNKTSPLRECSFRSVN